MVPCLGCCGGIGTWPEEGAQAKLQKLFCSLVQTHSVFALKSLAVCPKVLSLCVISLLWIKKRALGCHLFPFGVVIYTNWFRKMNV